MVKQKLISVPNKIGLNPKSLRSAYVTKANVQLIAIHRSDGDVKPGGPSDTLRDIFLHLLMSINLIR